MRLVGRIKEHRLVASHYDKTATSYLAFVRLAAIQIWIALSTRTSVKRV